MRGFAAMLVITPRVRRHLNLLCELARRTLHPTQLPGMLQKLSGVRLNRLASRTPTHRRALLKEPNGITVAATNPGVLLMLKAGLNDACFGECLDLTGGRAKLTRGPECPG
jgi:hypothetical protein